MTIEEAVVPDPNYFVCTLGQAASINSEHPHQFSNINDFLDELARSIPDAPAVGLPIPSRADGYPEWSQRIISFGDLQQGSIIVSEHLAKLLGPPSYTDTDSARPVCPSRVVALLCPSSADFLFTWLGLMRKGYSVLLIAPQCQPSAIAHLCKTCGVSTLLYDLVYEALAIDAASFPTLEHGLCPLPLPWMKTKQSDVFSFIEQEKNQTSASKPLWDVVETDVAYLHHTSGTSTGLPKPIPQSHRAAVGVLPCLDGSREATFTTTPLYHGGIADCFRAWTSGALIWLFPGKEVPITGDNILKSLACADRLAESPAIAKIKYFSSVPYVLQMLAAEKEGMKKLEEMDIVGVGGAALPQAAGDDLVRKGVNLISRFGSAECGFLMSSHRDYAKDEEWQYLRSSQGSKDLRFELQPDRLSELVITPGWPHMAKRNRPDGSFATADLFELHPSIPNAWKYHSRADSQLTLITGKKFDPAPLEAAIATSSLLEDVLVFGNGQQYPGALLFRSSKTSDLPASILLDEVWPHIEGLNSEGQAHTRLSRSMLVVMPVTAPRLEKSSKGTILRAQAEKTFARQIGDSYENADRAMNGDETHGVARSSVEDDEVPSAVLSIVKSVLNTEAEIPVDVDLFSYGVDSVACMQTRGLLQKNLLFNNSPSLPLNVVYDCGTIQSLSKYILDRRHGKVVETEDETKVMLDLVQEYGDFTDKDRNIELSNGLNGLESRSHGGEVVVLTGATGALGAHLLDQLRKREDVSQIICLVRAKDPVAAHERVRKCLLQRKKDPVLDSDGKVVCHVAKLSDGRLGLPEDVFDDVAERATIIIHAAWAVNFSMRLKSFVKDHIAGIRNLINLALHSHRPTQPTFLFCSSTASVLGPTATSPIPETISTDPSTASPLGYSRSKWVAEAICSRAHAKTRLRNHIAVLRIGQLCGDTRSGVWNVTEAWPLMLSSVHVTNTLPDLDEPLSWLPVDLAAQAVLQIAARKPLLQDGEPDIPVYHILNNDRTAKWSDLLRWLRNLAVSFETVPPKQWIRQLEGLKGDQAKHPARKLLGLWKSAYGGEEQGGGTHKDALAFETKQTEEAAPVMGSVRPIGEEHFRLIWQWMEEEMVGKDRL